MYSVRPDIPEEVQKELAEYSPLIQKLLFYRGIATRETAHAFLHPTYEDNIDPFLLSGMDVAVLRIRKAIDAKEKIIIYSDYDADGIPGAVVLHDFFKKIGYENFENYIPHRVLEGFGLNHDAITRFAEDGVKLIITVDCGIADTEEAQAIAKLGMDLIVTDHHLPKVHTDGTDNLPQALAILDHKKADDTYPEEVLCGAGTAYKLVQALLQRYGTEWNVPLGWEKWLLDMVGIATVSDMVPLIGENRIFAYYGLKVLQKSPRIGLTQLLSLVNIDQKHITEDDISFMIAPRVNAASRMGMPHDAFRMLVETNVKKASAYALHLNSINDERKVIVAGLVKEIKKIWNAKDPEKKRKVLVAGNPDWKPSLLGLVASSLQDEHAGPVFLWGREEGTTLKGSCRSDGCVNVVEMMREASDLFHEFGGHAASGGFAVQFEKVDMLADGLEASYQKLSVIKEKEGIIADTELSIDDVTEKLASEIGMLAPFGMDNPKPVFMFRNARVHESGVFGKKRDHLKINFKNSRGAIVSAIAFFTKPEDFGVSLESGATINLIGNIEKSFFRGRPEVRLRVVDIVANS